MDSNVREEDFTKVFRLGKKKERKHRPILFGLKKLENKYNILSKKKNLKEIDVHVKIVEDCTPEQRKHDRDIHLEMKEKNQKNTDDNFLFIMTG